MKPNQRLLADDGHEVCLFPCEAMYITQGEHDVLALDFRPVNVLGARITAMKCYAPFSGRIVYTGNDHNCILQSDDLVYMPDGSLSYGRVLVAHSEVAPVLNTHYIQGQQFYTTGNFGQSYGEHLHMEIASVSLPIERYWNSGTGIGLYKAIHMWNGMFVNDTALIEDGGYNWVEYNGGVTPPTPPTPEDKKPHKFPWVLYANRLRNNRANV